MNTTFDERRVYALELRDIEVEKRTMVGLAAPYNEETAIGGLYIEVLAPGVFKKSIQEAARGLPLLAFHDKQSWPVGKSIGWEETERGLVGMWEFANTDEANRTYDLARDDFLTGLSVGFQPIKSDIDPGTDTRPPRVTRKEARLFETSVVPTPQYASAQISLVRTAGIVKAKPNLDRWKQWYQDHA